MELVTLTKTEIEQCLKEIETFQQCTLCCKKFIDPVRIKTCGHFFCKICLKLSNLSEHNCPICNEFYDINDLDYKNIAMQCTNDLNRIYALLEGVKRKSEGKDVCVKLNKENVFIHNRDEYHVKFTKTIVKINDKGETRLHIACKKRRIDEVISLIQSDIDINAKDYAGWAPLHEAIESQSFEIVELLLENNCLINIPGADCTTPLHKAVCVNNLNIVNLLLKYGADKNAVNNFGSKPEDLTGNELIEKSLQLMDEIPFNRKIFNVFLPGNISLYCHSIDEEAKKRLQECSDIQVVEKVDFKLYHLTHFVIKKTHKLSFKIMEAMLHGLQFLTQDDIDNFLQGNYFINIPNHRFLFKEQLNCGIKRSNISYILKLPKLFADMKFYIEDHKHNIQIYHLKVNKEYLSNLIQAGGGKVLNRPSTPSILSEINPYHSFFSKIYSSTYFCCNFIIYEENNPPTSLHKMKQLQHKSSKWLIDCIINYEIMD